jgi:hypothetical protein
MLAGFKRADDAVQARQWHAVLLLDDGEEVMQ